MKRIEARFKALRASRKAALVPYIMAGCPDVEHTVDILNALVMGGADLIELGVPFSDPMADGAVIQRASDQAIRNGVRLHHVLDMVAQFRLRDVQTPIVLMSYINPILAMGENHFIARAVSAGVDGVLAVDYPPEECQNFAHALIDNDLAPIFLLAPTSSALRAQQVEKLGRGYIYYVSLKGVTGASHINLEEVGSALATIRQGTHMPVGVGFGIRDSQSAAHVASFADAVIVGSLFIQTLEGVPTGQLAAVARKTAQSLRAAMDEARTSEETS